VELVLNSNDEQHVLTRQFPFHGSLRVPDLLVVENLLWISLNPETYRFRVVGVFPIDVLLQLRGNVPDVPLAEELVPISNNVVSFHLQGTLNVHAHDFGDGDTGKQAIHYSRPDCRGNLRCIPGMVPRPNLAVNNKPVSVCMSCAIVYNLYYVSHVEELLHIESLAATTLLGFPILSSRQS
jgi:hypothetical protein